jgi:hypothetical protein
MNVCNCMSVRLSHTSLIITVGVAPTEYCTVHVDHNSLIRYILLRVAVLWRGAALTTRIRQVTIYTLVPSQTQCPNMPRYWVMGGT